MHVCRLKRGAESMPGEYVIALAGKTNRSMDRIVAFFLVPMANVPML